MDFLANPIESLVWSLIFLSFLFNFQPYIQKISHFIFHPFYWIFYISYYIFNFSIPTWPSFGCYNFSHTSEDINDFKFSSGFGIDCFPLGFLFIAVCLVSVLAVRGFLQMAGDSWLSKHVNEYSLESWLEALCASGVADCARRQRGCSVKKSPVVNICGYFFLC